MKKNDQMGGFFLQAIGFFPIVFLITILYFARGSFMTAMDNWGKEVPQGEGERLLEKQLFINDRYQRRNVVDPDEVIELANGTFSIQTYNGSDMSVTEAEFKLSNGDTYHHTILPYSEYLKAYPQYKLYIFYEFDEAYVTYFDPETQEWVINKRLRSGVSFPLTTAFVNIENETYLIFDEAYAYQEGEDGTVIARNDLMGKLFINPRGYGYDFMLGYAMEEGITTEMWTLESDEPLVDMENPEAYVKTGETAMEFWERCNYGTNHRFLMDGYYSKIPQTYPGYEENGFWRNPGIELPYNFILYGTDRASEDLGYIQLYLSSRNMEEAGYYKTEPQSDWLQETYGLEGGYYDTRSNADMGVALISAYQKYNEPYFLEQAKKLLTFYKEFANKNHYSVLNETSEEGWLVQDYWHENGEYELVHSALNNQLQEINFLYLMGTELGDASAISLGDKLLKGIENTSDSWIKPGGDLYYGYIAGAPFDIKDYSGLTYNDMYTVQAQLVKMGRARNAALDNLMQSNKAFLDKEGITSYFQ